MTKDKTITMRFDADVLAAIDYMSSKFPESPLRTNRTDLIMYALIEMAERLDTEHGTDFHEVMIEAMSDD